MLILTVSLFLPKPIFNLLGVDVAKTIQWREWTCSVTVDECNANFVSQNEYFPSESNVSDDSCENGNKDNLFF